MTTIRSSLPPAVLLVANLVVATPLAAQLTLEEPEGCEVSWTPLPKDFISEYQNSYLLSDNGVSIFTLNDVEPLYISCSIGEAAAIDFLNQDLYFPNDAGETVRLLPLGGSTGFALEKIENDINKPHLRGLPPSGERYYFSQPINGIPVLGSSLIIHIKNGNEIYSIDGRVLTNTEVPTAQLSEEEATQIAFKETDTNTELDIQEQFIVNPHLYNTSEASENYITVAVRAGMGQESAEYFIDLVSGSIVYQRPLSFSVLD